jgi:hypothetical protein
MAGVGGSEIILLIFIFGSRIFGAIYCSKQAEKFNRNITVWSIFGILSPIVAMIWLNIIGKNTNWHKGS